jgi:hypothetical protein
MIVVGIGGVFWIQSDTRNNEERTQRAGVLGTGLGCLGAGQSHVVCVRNGLSFA